MKTSRYPTTERHTTPNFLMRVPAPAAKIAAAVLQDFLHCKVKIVYRDKSTDRPRRYMRSRAWEHLGVVNTNGFCLKKDATHADLYSQGERGTWRDHKDAMTGIHMAREQLFLANKI